MPGFFENLSTLSTPWGKGGLDFKPEKVFTESVIPPHDAH
jgi:hypothetical protein